jgi:hypothetical protein
MDQMDDDATDAAWHQRQMEEQQMLYEDPGYFEFLKNYEEMR